MSASKADNAGKPRTARSAIANGTTLFGRDVDGRSATARRMRDLIEDYATQVGGDPSPAQQAIIRNSATLTALLEESQAQIVRGEEIDDELFLKRCAMLSRLLGQLGLKRLARDISPKGNGKEIDGHARMIREAKRG